MQERFARTEMLFGTQGMERLSKACVAVFGIGGVGGYTIEALARSGIGKLILIDDDRVCESNINRQIIATQKTIGRYKTDVMKERILEINPEAAVETHRCFFLPERSSAFDFKSYTYVVDAIDTVTAKIALVLCAREAGVPIISCMGAGNKSDPSRFEVADIFNTSVCPLAKVMRKELKNRGIAKLKVVYSKEPPSQPLAPDEDSGTDEDLRTGRRTTPGSNAFVPAVAGLIMAGEVIRDLLAGSKQEG